MHISVNHPQSVSDYDRRNIDVWCNPYACETAMEMVEGRHLYCYIDTHFGTFRRSVNYWVYSPYGWESVSWG